MCNTVNILIIVLALFSSTRAFESLEDFLYAESFPSPFTTPNFKDTIASLRSEYEVAKKKRAEVHEPMVTRSEKPSASEIFTWMENFVVDPNCEAWEKYYFRQADGSCNWLKKDQWQWGAAGQPFFREVNNSYKDGISEPRDGPSPREVSNAFFVKKPHALLDRTGLLVGWVEFLIHDFLGTERSDEAYDLEIPQCDNWLDPYCEGGKSMKFWRNKAFNNSTTKPREVKNGVSTWLDLSPLYGSSESVTRKLRTLVDGKMKTSIGPDGYEYLPLNNAATFPNGGTNDVSFPNQTVFATGDPRGNQDWMLVAVETLLLREHNRVCDIVKAKFPEYDDERIFQTTRAIMGVKELTMSNEYQMSYFTKDMPPPTTDGLALFRQLHGKTQKDINVMVTYPFKYAMRDGKPLIASLELDIGYRFHEILPEVMSVVNPAGVSLFNISVVGTAWNSSGFLQSGLENIVKGVLATKVPSFHSGTSEQFRSMNFNFNDPRMGDGFDIVAWTIEHEREMGVPTYNQYFSAYTGVPSAPVRKNFTEFTSNTTLQRLLAELYKTPDDVDLYLGEVLDESLFPGTIIPTAQLITSLVSLSGLGAVDRFMGGYSVMRCVLVERPWDCTPSNVIDELAWKPAPSLLFPRARVPDLDWLEEMGLSEGGNLSLWKLITKNSNVDCVQMNPLLPADPETNPILCIQPPSRADQIKDTLTVIKAGLAGFAIGLIVAGGVIVIVFAVWYIRRRKLKTKTKVKEIKKDVELRQRVKELEIENERLAEQNRQLQSTA